MWSNFCGHTLLAPWKDQRQTLMLPAALTCLDGGLNSFLRSQKIIMVILWQHLPSQSHCKRQPMRKSLSMWHWVLSCRRIKSDYRYKAAQYYSCTYHEIKFLPFLTPFASLWWEQSKDQPPLCPVNLLGFCVGIGKCTYLCFVWNATSVIYFWMFSFLLHAPYSNMKITNIPLQLMPCSLSL